MENVYCVRCGKLLGKVEGKAELKCHNNKCKKLNYFDTTKKEALRSPSLD